MTGRKGPSDPFWTRLLKSATPLALGVLRGVPLHVIEAIFEVTSVGQAVLRPTRARRAYRWACAAERGVSRRLGVTRAILANQGRFFALSTAPTIVTPDIFRKRVTIEGHAHLDAALRSGGGVILLGFHVLPGIAALALANEGYRFTITGEERAFKGWHGAIRAWQPVLERWEDPVVWSDTVSRAQGLARLRSDLLAGGAVYMTADGPAGQHLFRIPLPVGALVIRSGWWALRRLTGATTLPVLAHTADRAVIVRILPPLPAPARDRGDDEAACQVALTTIIEQHVRQFHDQSASLVTWSEGNAL